MGTETETEDRNARIRLTGLIALALVLTAVVAYRALEASSLHGRLSVPPLYDDVSYFISAVQWTQAAGSRSLAASVWHLMQNHAPFSTLVAAIGFRLVPDSYVGPYLVNAVFVFAFLLGIIWLTWKRPFDQVATCLIAAACVPALWHTVGEGRPDLPAGLALGVALGAIVHRGVLQRARWTLAALGAGCGVAASIKPTAFPAALVLLGSMFALRLFLDCVLAGGLRASLRKAVIALLSFGLGLLAVAGLLMGPNLVGTITYIFDVFITQRDLWTSGESFWVGLQYFLVGSGGKAGLNFWLWIGLSLMVLRLLLAATSDRAARFDAIALLAALVISYAIPSVQEIKTYFFGAIFYAIFIVAMALNFCASQSLIESCLASGPPGLAGRGRLPIGGVRAVALAAAVLLFVKMVVIGSPSLALWLNEQQQEDIRVSTERVWKLVRDMKPDDSGALSVAFSSAYPVTPGTVELYAAQAHATMRIRQELYHRTLDATEQGLLAANVLVVSSSVPHTLVGPRVGDELIQRLDANKDVCLLDSLTFPDIRLRVYRRPC